MEHKVETSIKKFTLKILSFLIIILPIGFNSLTVRKVFASDTCYGFTSPGNPFPCAGTCPTGANCTWWAAYKRPDLMSVEAGNNAGQAWIDSARNGDYIIDKTVSQKVVGSIAVWANHVAYIESVNSNGTVNLSEMNCTTGMIPYRSWVANIDVNSYAGTFLGFILKKYQNDYYTMANFGPKLSGGINPTNIGVYDPTNNNWFYKLNIDGPGNDAYDHLPGSNAQSVPITHSDFDGDGKTDVALFHPETNTYEYRESSTNIVRNVTFGYQGLQPIFNSSLEINSKLIPVTDFEGWDPITHTVYVRYSNGTNVNFPFNYSGITMYGGADFDGDGISDLVGIDANYHWHIRYGKNLADTTHDLNVGFGFSPAEPIVGGDFDGDHKTDFAVWNPVDNTWWFRYSRDNHENHFAYGYYPALPLLADWDGDGYTDISIWDSTNNMWYWRNSKTGVDGPSENYGYSPAYPI